MDETKLEICAKLTLSDEDSNLFDHAWERICALRNMLSNKSLDESHFVAYGIDGNSFTEQDLDKVADTLYTLSNTFTGKFDVEFLA